MDVSTLSPILKNVVRKVIFIQVIEILNAFVFLNKEFNYILSIWAY